MFKFSDKSYLTRGERASFERLMKAEVISWFRLRPCEICGKDIPKMKRFCSWDCYQETQDDGEAEGD